MEKIPKDMKEASEHFRAISSFKHGANRRVRMLCQALFYVVSKPYSNHRAVIVALNEEHRKQLEDKAKGIFSVESLKNIGFTTYKVYKDSNREGQVIGLKYFIDPACLEDEIAVLLKKWEQYDDPRD
ncbi:hypothetical protein HOU35_gp038 [Acinetobacter phage vB_AbaM_B09_Aci05]|uniref:Uncharacterized protein n=1 Tax=Acinetobacter phage vB_AbaM_B09_Aci05 TaxID=2315458 RepID=A0A386KDL5_9CAUD|nr:hypothetical protein HOU35_gp038 [Acinetobacter phage vB_AbaM_B09_Aci05]AYD82394.1 hypothetical protein Aci05_139 [Acinetobacter phage vB_AbaM_B09_Aci05]